MKKTGGGVVNCGRRHGAAITRRDTPQGERIAREFRGTRRLTSLVKVLDFSVPLPAPGNQISRVVSSSPFLQRTMIKQLLLAVALVTGSTVAQNNLGNFLNQSVT